MCFGGGSDKSDDVTPAAAPAAPAATAVDQNIGGSRKAEDDTLYGSSTPTFRRDPSSTSGGATAGGTGLRM